MTQERCVLLSQGRQYGGVFNDTCYASDFLQGTVLTLVSSCDLPCPGNAGQICGGLTNATTLRRRNYYGQQISRRAAPPTVLLTLFGRVGNIGSTDIPSNAGPSGPAIGPSPSSAAPIPLPGSSSLNVPPLQIPSSLVTLENFPPGLPSVSLPSGGATTIITGRTATQTRSNTLSVTSVVTTIFYTTVNPLNPTAMVKTEFHTTIYFEDCGCPTQKIPSVCMVTTVAQCHRCGLRGENTVTLVVPSLSDSLPQNQISLAKETSPLSFELVKSLLATQPRMAVTSAAPSFNYPVASNPTLSQARNPIDTVGPIQQEPLVPNPNKAASQSQKFSPVETVVAAKAPAERHALHITGVFGITACVLGYVMVLA
ncbi:glycoside hydrolase [Colletotrichum truncatum]|uniref:Glycoside hydrolase n=1 Tax=Colletotrichum truncatum TaxID=5467 RepID=A0ACC3YKK9_COLTU|nr:glycoside hydrolase [Colletotrichum truncatum]KAF6798293.1 glycoside hydrolase [Colletotrichum truncatum]